MFQKLELSQTSLNHETLNDSVVIYLNGTKLKRLSATKKLETIF
jgi:hypothetical protein